MPLTQTNSRRTGQLLTNNFDHSALGCKDGSGGHNQFMDQRRYYIVNLWDDITDEFISAKHFCSRDHGEIWIGEHSGQPRLRIGEPEWVADPVGYGIFTSDCAHCGEPLDVNGM